MRPARGRRAPAGRFLSVPFPVGGTGAAGRPLRPEPRGGHARLALLLPVLALLAGALGLFAAAPAQAQTTVWSATLTVDEASNAVWFGCAQGVTISGTIPIDQCSSSTVLTDDDFTYGGTDYTITRITVGGLNSQGGNRLRLAFDSLTPAAAKTALSSLTLTVGTGADAKSFAISTLTAGTEYTNAVLQSGTTHGLSWSDGDSVALKLTEPAAATKPAKPTGLTATAGDAQVTLSWTDPSDSSITKYQVQQKAGDAAWGSWADIPTSAPGETNATSYTVTSLNNGTAYRFRIRAVNAQGNSPRSDVAGPATPAAVAGPAVTGALAITSDPGTYTTDDDLEVTVTFDKAIVVTGTPKLKVRVGTGPGSQKTADCARKGGMGEDAKKLVCTYTIADGDEDTDGVSVEANRLSLPRSPTTTVRDSNGNDANLNTARLPRRARTRWTRRRRRSRGWRWRRRRPRRAPTSPRRSSRWR